MDKPQREEAFETTLFHARLFFENLESAVALVRPDEWRIVYENERFRRWLPGHGESPDVLATRLSGFDAKAAQACLDGDSYSFETIVYEDSRPKPLRVAIRRLAGPGRVLAMVECFDISRQREVEHMMESYSEIFEKAHLDMSQKLREGDKLIENVLPGFVRDELNEYGVVVPRRFERLTTLMLDFVDFTDMGASHDLTHLLMMLNEIYTAFDRITANSGCYRVKTIGDAYLAVPGLPEPGGRQASKVARMALRMRAYIQKRNRTYPEEWNCRIGIATGPAIGAVVGTHGLSYDVFGPGVNYVDRLQALADPMQILVCEQTRELLEPEYFLGEWGEADIKGFGPQVIYELRS